MSAVHERLNSSTARLDALVDRLMRQDGEREAAERAAQARADAAQAKANAERCGQYQSKYDSVFSAFGTRAPAPIEGESPGRFRKRLFETLQRRLPSDHEWSSVNVRADDLSDPNARNQIEALVIKAALAEAAKPSVENLPASGALVRRDMVDDMSGARSIEWRGRESFIKQLTRPGSQVVRIADPRRGGVVHWGAPFSRAG